MYLVVLCGCSGIQSIILFPVSPPHQMFENEQLVNDQHIIVRLIHLASILLELPLVFHLANISLDCNG